MVSRTFRPRLVYARKCGFSVRSLPAYRRLLDDYRLCLQFTRSITNRSRNCLRSYGVMYCSIRLNQTAVYTARVIDADWHRPDVDGRDL